MQLLFWRMKRFRKEGIARPSATRVRIEMVRTPAEYSFAWLVAGKCKRRLSKRELHELGMRVEKHVANVNQTAPSRLERSTIYVSL